jgi:enterobacterial common antigen flippase
MTSQRGGEPVAVGPGASPDGDPPRPDAPADTPPRRRLLRVLGGLTAVHVLVNVLSLATGPLQARLLGPEGRGQLALVLVVTSTAQATLTLGLGTFVAREISQGRDQRDVLGTVAALSLGLGILGAVCAYPVSRLFGEAEFVHNLILAAMLALPLTVVGGNLLGVFWGDEDWVAFSANRLLVPGLTVVFYLVLWALGSFTVISASIAVFAASVLAFVPLWRVVRGAGGWSFDRGVAREALSFGGRFSVSGIAAQSNQRADQFVIAAVLSTRELGFYVVAASLATATTIVSQALYLVMVPLVATGDTDTGRRIVRATLAAMLLAAVVVALLAGPLMTFLFGAEFASSADLARILVFGAVFVACKSVITGTLVGAGHPGEVAIAEVATLALLVPALVLVVPSLGVEGAAATVGVVTALNFLALVLRARHWLGGTVRDYLVVSREDAGWVTRRLLRRG